MYARLNVEHRHSVDDLVLTVINTGDGYDERCFAARQSPDFAARSFAVFARGAATRYGRDNGYKFSAQEILLVAAELAFYYVRHVAEIDRIQGEDSKTPKSV